MFLPEEKELQLPEHIKEMVPEGATAHLRIALGCSAPNAQSQTAITTTTATVAVAAGRVFARGDRVRIAARSKVFGIVEAFIDNSHRHHHQYQHHKQQQQQHQQQVIIQRMPQELYGIERFSLSRLTRALVQQKSNKEWPCAEKWEKYMLEQKRSLPKTLKVFTAVDGCKECGWNISVRATTPGDRLTMHCEVYDHRGESITKLPKGRLRVRQVLLVKESGAVVVEEHENDTPIEGKYKFKRLKPEVGNYKLQFEV